MLEEIGVVQGKILVGFGFVRPEDEAFHGYPVIVREKDRVDLGIFDVFRRDYDGDELAPGKVSAVADFVGILQKDSFRGDLASVEAEIIRPELVAESGEANKRRKGRKDYFFHKRSVYCLLHSILRFSRRKVICPWQTGFAKFAYGHMTLSPRKSIIGW